MATLYITEYAESGYIASGVPVGREPSLACQTVAIGGSSTQSSAFGNKTRLIRVHTDAICSILVGTNPTATAAKSRMAANQTEYFQVDPAAKLAVITNS